MCIPRLLVVPLVLLAAPGCAFFAAEAKPPRTTVVKATDVRVEDGRRRMILARSREDGGVFFTRVPFELNGAWRAEVTTGLFDPRTVGDSGDAIFGLEIDLVTDGPRPDEFYGVFARRFETPARGLQVFASSGRGGSATNHGQTFFGDATAVDLAIETDGATVTYQARDSAVAGAWRTVATSSLLTPSLPHHPGFGVFGAPKGATVGFTGFRVPENGALPPGRPAEAIALHAVFEAALDVLDAGYAVAGPGADQAAADAADDALERAEAGLVRARGLIEALDAPVTKRKREKTPAERALKAVTKSERLIAKARGRLAKKGPRAARSVTKSISKQMFKQAVLATDALLADDVRATLPGDGLSRWVK